MMNIRKSAAGAVVLVAAVALCASWSSVFGTTVLGPAQRLEDNPMKAEPFACGTQAFELEYHLRSLPGGMRQVLARGGEMADHGEAFRATDVVGPGDENLPTRRFVAAAIGDKRLFAAVEQGGIGYSVEYWAFERNGSRWIGNIRWIGGGAPETLEQLLAVACKEHVPAAQPRSHHHVWCRTFGTDGALTMIYQDSITRMDYVLHPPREASGVPEIARYALDRQATYQDRADLLPLMQAARGSSENDCPAAVVDHFIDVLEASLKSGPPQ